MKKFLSILLFPFIIITCYSIPVKPPYYGTRFRYYYQMSNPIPSTDNMNFEDDIISINFNISNKLIYFTLTNKTTGTLKINWDEASVVINTKASRVLHPGIENILSQNIHPNRNYVNKNILQPPTVVPPNSSIDDGVTASESDPSAIFYEKLYYCKYSGSLSYFTGTIIGDLFLSRDYNEPEIREKIVQNIGKKLSLFLPIVSQDKKRDYNFEFTISDIKPIIDENESFNVENENKSDKIGNNSTIITKTPTSNEEVQIDYSDSAFLSTQNESILLDIINTIQGKYLLVHLNENTPMKISQKFDIVRFKNADPSNEQSTTIGEAQVIQIKDNKAALQYTLSIEDSISKITDKIVYK